MHVCVSVCVLSVCDHLFQGVVSIIHKPLLPRGSMRYIRSLHSTCVCFYAQVSVHVCVCPNVCVTGVNARVLECVCVCVCVCVPICAYVCECVCPAVCLAVLYYITLNYNRGGNVTACDLILNTSITFSPFKRKCA